MILSLLLVLLAACGGPGAATALPATGVPATATSASAATTAAPATATIAPPAPTSAPATAAPAGQPTELVVFAAASLTESFGEIGKAFEAANPGTTITFNFAGSQQLAQQIGAGAPADVFASANKKQLDVVVESGQIISGTARTFARNRLIVVFPKDNPAGVATLNDLAKPNLKLVLAAKEVPVGQYALDMLDKASQDAAYGPSFKDAVLNNVVSYEQDVKAVLAKVTLGEADAGIVYASDLSGAASAQAGQLAIPDPLNTIASYPIASITGSANAAMAQKFIDYVLAAEGQAVLVKYGFSATNGSASGAAPASGPLDISGLVNTPATLQVADLRKLKQTTIKATDKGGVEKEYVGVLLASLLEQVGVKPEASQLELVGGDGFSQTLALADVRADPAALIAILEDGSLRDILPSQMPKTWVKGLVKITVK